VPLSAEDVSLLEIVAVGNGSEMLVKVTPGSSRDRVLGRLANALKLAVAAPPEAGKANDAVSALLVQALRLRRGQVSIVSGHRTSLKRVRVDGLPPEALRARLIGEAP
jgi:uncharacterized protein YggU (UPF0235/DUF167 family)